MTDSATGPDESHLGIHANLDLSITPIVPSTPSRIASLEYWARLIVGAGGPQSDSHRRYARVAQAVMSGLAGKAAAVVVSIISVPLTIGYLGAERYGLWITIGTLLAWFQLADFGLGGGVTNALAEAYGQDRPDMARQYVSSSLTILTIITAMIGGLIAFVWHWIDWATVFNVHSAQARAEVGPALAVAMSIFLLNFPLSLIGRIYTSHQEGKLANYWGMAGNIASLFVLIGVTQTRGGLVLLVLALSGTSLLTSVASGIWLFVWHKPWLAPRFSAIRMSSARKLGNISGQFFVIQIAVLLIFQTDNLIIAHFVGPAAVTPYNIAYKLFAYTTLIQALIFPNLWPAYTEAIARNDIRWVKRTYRLNITSSTLLTAAMCVPLLVFGALVIKVWAGPAALPPPGLLAGLAVWNVISAACTATSCLLSASGRIRNQMYYATATALLNIGVSIWLVRPFGITGVIAGTIIAYLICNVVPCLVDTELLIRSLSAPPPRVGQAD